MNKNNVALKNNHVNYCISHNEDFLELFPEQWMCESCFVDSIMIDIKDAHSLHAEYTSEKEPPICERLYQQSWYV